MKPKVHYIAAPTPADADWIAGRQGWSLGNFRWIGSVETIRGLSPNTNLYVYDDGGVRDVIARLQGKQRPWWNEGVRHIVAEATARGLNIIQLS